MHRLRATLTALVLAVAGCHAGSQGTNPTGPDSLAIGFTSEPATLDFTTTDGAAIPEALLVNVYQGLVALDQDTGEIVPALASSWQVSDDRLTYDFELRDAATFSNGAPFTADDVKFSIERVQSDAWSVSLKSAMDVVKTVEVISPSHVRVRLARPSNDWLYRLTTRVGAMFTPTGVDALATNPVGTGPYVVDRWVRGDSIRLVARDDYWGTPPPMRTVTLKYFADPTAAVNALRTGGIDVIGTVQAPELLSVFDQDAGFAVIEGTTNSEVTLAINNERLPDVRVRQAIRHAINHGDLLELVWAGRGVLIGAPVPPTDPWYEDLSERHPFDPARARELLNDAGWDGATLALRVANLPYAVDAAQVVASNLADVGVDTEIEPVEFPARWLDVVFADADYDLSIVAHVEPRDIAIYADPGYYFRYDSRRVQALLADADLASPDEQAAIMRDVARQLADDAAADWLFLQPNLIVTRIGVRGLPQNRIGEAFDLTHITQP